MKNSNQTIIVIVALALGLVACLVCSLSISIFGFGIFSTNKTPTSVNTTNDQVNVKKYAINTAVIVDGVEIQVITVDKNYTPSNRNFNPNIGSKLVAVDLTIKNNRKEAISISPILNFKVQNENNKKFAIVLSDKNPTINSVIDPGKSTRGFLTFEVDEESKNLDLIFSPDFMSKENVIIAL